jgi:hypothetical protein
MNLSSGSNSHLNSNLLNFNSFIVIDFIRFRLGRVRVNHEIHDASVCNWIQCSCIHCNEMQDDLVKCRMFWDNLMESDRIELNGAQLRWCEVIQVKLNRITLIWTALSCIAPYWTALPWAEWHRVNTKIWMANRGMMMMTWPAQRICYIEWRDRNEYILA